jgi:Cys-tRNA(Pro)/Cys-tRNA(Cys) deacylase
MSRRSVGTPATTALTQAGIAFTVHEFTADPRDTSYGMAAAAALGLAPASVFKTLIAQVDASPVVALVPVSGQLDLKALAATHGGRRADVVEPRDAERLTGYVVGGISPFGQRRRMPTYVDESVLLLEIVYVSGGRRGLDLGVAPADLLNVTGGRAAALARGTPPSAGRP